MALLLPATQVLVLPPPPLAPLALVEPLVQGPPVRLALLQAPVAPELVLSVLPLLHKQLIIERAPL